MKLARDPQGALMSSRGFRRETFVVQNCLPMGETTGKALYRLKQLPLKVSRDTAYRFYPPFNHHTRGPPKVPLEAGSQNRAFSAFLSVPFPAKPVQISPGLHQIFKNLSGLREQAFWRSKTCPDCRIRRSKSSKLLHK